MNRIITSEVLVAYLQCHRKAFLLLCTNKRGTPNEYINILEQRKHIQQEEYINALKQKNKCVQPYTINNLKNGADFLVNVTLKAEELEAKCDLLTKVKGSSSLGRYIYEPTNFVGTYSISKEQKFELLLVGYLLRQIQKKLPAAGRIIGMGEKSYKVKLENSTKLLIPFLEPLREWAKSASPEAPSIILNKHCPYCRFQKLCKAKAEEEDNLSLLSQISTQKVVKKYEKRGIFTVKQLSYLFKLRRRKKRAKRISIAHKPELQALAINTGKIYLQDLPELTRYSNELFLDIEEIPDQQFYYLIGLLVCNEDLFSYYYFWADTSQDESKIWQQFLHKINQYPSAPIYHYGSYELKAIDKLCRRYRTECENIKNRLVNVNTHIYGKVYFPVKSNSLKEIGNFIGTSWTSPDASSLQSLIWRYYWNETGRSKYKQTLIIYNKEDCQALKLLVEELSRIQNQAELLSHVDFANQPKKHLTEISTQLHNQFEAILKFAHADYDNKKITLRQIENKESIGKKSAVHKRGIKHIIDWFLRPKRLFV